jgi:hypothetical protein
LAEEGSTENYFRIKIGLIFLLLFLSRKKVNRRPGFLFKLDAETVLKMAITIKNSTIDFLKKLSKNNNREWLSSPLSFASAKESGKEKQSRF